MTGVQVQRTRGPNLTVLTSYANKVPSEEGLRQANERNLVVASNKRLDEALVRSDEWQQPNVRPALPAWTGTYTGYEEVGKRLGTAIEYVDPDTGFRHVFPVPEQFQGQKDVILVAEHPDYSLEKDGKTSVVNATKVDLVQAFPDSNGWYSTDSVHGIPTGNQIDSSNAEARYLCRIAKRVAHVARAFNGLTYWRSVFLYYGPSFRLGMAVEAADAIVAAATMRPLSEGQPRGDAAKTQALFAPTATPRVSKLEVAGVSANNLMGLLGQFRRDLETPGSTASNELLSAVRKLEAMLPRANMK